MASTSSSFIWPRVSCDPLTRAIELLPFCVAAVRFMCDTHDDDDEITAGNPLLQQKREAARTHLVHMYTWLRTYQGVAIDRRYGLATHGLRRRR